MNKWMMGCLAMLGCGVMSAANEKVFEVFDKTAVPSYWKLLSIKALAQPEKRTVRLTYPQWKEGENQWPAFFWKYPAGTFEQDWSPYKYLAFDITYYGENDTIIMLRLDDQEAHIYQDTSCTVYGGGKRSFVVIPVQMLREHGLNVRKMGHFNLFLDKPAAEFVFDLGTIRLTDEPWPVDYASEYAAAMLPKYREALAAIQACPPSPLRADIEAEARRFVAMMSDPAELAAHRDELRTNDLLRRLPGVLARVRFFSQMREPYMLSPIPTTLKLRPDEISDRTYGDDLLHLHAARGEAESLQLLLRNAGQELKQATFSATALKDDDGHELTPELHVVGYIPVTMPTKAPFGFGLRGLYPDVLLPQLTFDVKPYTNQALWLSVWVPEDAHPGTYRGTATVTVPGGRELRRDIAVTVYPVTVPKLGKLKTSWIFQPANTHKWYKDDYDSFLKINLRYRFCMDKLATIGCLPWDKVFKVDADKKVTADWTAFDTRVEYWRSLGKNTFQGYPPRWFAYKPIREQIKDLEVEAQKLRMAVAHLKEKGWMDDFYLYIFDEPHPSKLAEVRDVCKFFQDAVGHDAHLILTACHDNIKDYEGYVNIYVPHITLFRPEYMAARQAAGDHVWMYTCCGTLNTRYPDTWKLDNYGTGHRAVGWWLYKYHVEGYLYWGVNYWEKDPWADAMTFPNCNGDGSMFYPDPERKGQPWPSVRLEIVRDGFEDYELLHLLAAKYAGKEDAEVRRLLSCEEIIPELKRYNETDDMAYVRLHRRLLELLSK